MENQQFVAYFLGETMGFRHFSFTLGPSKNTWRKSHPRAEDGQDFDSTWRSNGSAPALLFQAPRWHREAAGTAVRPHAWNRWFSIDRHRSSEESGGQRGEHSVYQCCWMVVSSVYCFFLLPNGPQFLVKTMPLKGIATNQVVSCPEGLKALAMNAPDVRILTCALDSHLNEVKFIVPGVGDFGDRYYGTTGYAEGLWGTNGRWHAPGWVFGPRGATSVWRQAGIKENKHCEKKCNQRISKNHAAGVGRSGFSPSFRNAPHPIEPTQWPHCDHHLVFDHSRLRVIVVITYFSDWK